MVEPLYQGAKDIFLVGVRAKFDAVEDQALKSTRALQDWKLLDVAGGKINSMYVKVSNFTREGSRNVWRHVGVAGVQQLGTRSAGTNYPEAQYIRGYETAVSDPNNQVAAEFIVPEERENEESNDYKDVINRAQKLLYEIDRQNVADLFELWNLAFTAPASYPSIGRFAAKGNRGKDGNYTALTEPIVSTVHARADGGATQSNAVTGSGNSLAFSDPNYYTAKENAGAFKDDVGKPMPMLGGKTTIIVPPANGLVRLAQEINQSDWKTLTANNDINVLQGLMSEIKSSPYLLASYYITTIKNTKAWFLLDETIRDPETGTGLVQITFVPLETRTERRESIDAVVYKVKEEYAYVWTDWRNIIGSLGDGAAYSL